MFDQLSSRLQKVMKFLRGEGKITEKNMTEALKMIRMTFLEADVNYRVVKDFEESLKKKSSGSESPHESNPCPTSDQDCEG